MIEPQKWASALGSLSDTVTLPDEDLQFASFKKLFPALTQIPLSEGGVAPQRTDFNTLFKLLGDNIFYIQQGGVFSYSDTADYERGSFVKYNNELYLCIQDNSSLNKHAPTDAKYWKKVATEDFVKASINNLNIFRKNYGNDYYDDSDITSLIYAGNGEGTIRNEIANGDFSRVHPGQTIVGRVTGTTYIVVGCNVYLNRGNPSLTRNHLGLIPIQLVGNSDSLLWSGQLWTGDTTKNTAQGYAPWNADNEDVGKNETCAYKDSYMAKTVIPKVINNWLKKDFEDQGISILTFRNLFSTGFDANLPCMSYPAWKGACLYAEWADCKAVLMSEPEVYGGYRWASSPYDSQMQHLQLPLFRHRSIYEIIIADIWLKDVASVSGACAVAWRGTTSTSYASSAFRVCPLFLIA